MAVGLLSKLFGSGRATDSPELARAVDRAVSLVEPRLKLEGGYPGRYREAVGHALGYCRDLAARVPGPISVDRESFVHDPLVHALFPSIDEVRAAMCISQAMRDYRKAHPAASEVYALMGMRRNERRLFGVEMEGEALRRDVPQQVIYFSDHTLADPAPTEAQARDLLAWDLFDSLLGHVARRVEGRKQEKAALEAVKDEILARLHAAPAAGRPALEAELAEVLQQAQRLNAALELGQYGKDFAAVLRQPQRHLYLEPALFRLDAMGIRREADMATGSDVAFCDLVGRDRRRWTVVMVHCGNVLAEATLSDRLLSAHRRLGV